MSLSFLTPASLLLETVSVSPLDRRGLTTRRTCLLMDGASGITATVGNGLTVDSRPLHPR